MPLSRSPIESFPDLDAARETASNLLRDVRDLVACCKDFINQQSAGTPANRFGILLTDGRLFPRLVRFYFRDLKPHWERLQPVLAELSLARSQPASVGRVAAPSASEAIFKAAGRCRMVITGFGFSEALGIIDRALPKSIPSALRAYFQTRLDLYESEYRAIAAAFEKAHPGCDVEDRDLPPHLRGDHLLPDPNSEGFRADVLFSVVSSIRWDRASFGFPMKLLPLKEQPLLFAARESLRAAKIGEKIKAIRFLRLCQAVVGWIDCDSSWLESDLEQEYAKAAHERRHGAVHRLPKSGVGVSAAVKSKRRRRAAHTAPRPLTVEQTEAMQLVAEHKGNFTAAGKALGKSRQAVSKLYRKGAKKLGKSAIKTMTRTQRLPTDPRGQATVVDPNASDLNASDPEE